MTHKGRERKLSVTVGITYWPNRTWRPFREYRRGKRLVLRVYTLCQYAPQDGYTTWVESQDPRERVAFPLERRS